jgi:hypothetical protein
MCRSTPRQSSIRDRSRAIVGEAVVKMYRFVFVMAVCVLCVGAVASASPITYQVTVNTSSIAGTVGSLDFNFNPGFSATQAASLQILSFISDGTLVGGPCVTGGPCLTGDVAGTLPSTVTFDNGTAFNDYFDGFTFGTMMSFNVSVYGPALSAPNGVSTSGSTFAFSMFSNAVGTIPTLTTDVTNGFAATIDINLDGTTTLANFSSQTSITAVETSPVPEPTSLGLVGTGIVVLWNRRKRQSEGAKTAAQRGPSPAHQRLSVEGR